MTKEIWNPMMPYIPDTWNMCFAEYEHVMIREANCVYDISSHMAENLSDTRFDCIIGHSMGGLVALQLVDLFGIKTESMILIETNLRPAMPFYRNLLLPQNAEMHEAAVMSVIKSEMPYYSDTLKNSYQNAFDYTIHLKRNNTSIHALFGDRGEPGYEKQIDDLNLDVETQSKLRFHFIKDACHLPMIENPCDTAACIISILTAFIT